MIELKWREMAKMSIANKYKEQTLRLNKKYRIAGLYIANVFFSAVGLRNGLLAVSCG